MSPDLAIWLKLILGEIRNWHFLSSSTPGEVMEERQRTKFSFFLNDLFVITQRIFVNENDVFGDIVWKL